MTGVLLALMLAQNFEQRGFIENQTLVYAQTAPNDSGYIVNQTLLRWDISDQVAPWLKVAASFDARTDTHEQTERGWDFDVDDRSIKRPAFSLRRASATLHKGKFTLELGRQFIRWGKADILNPTDRFAPKDYLGSVVSSNFLGVIAARATYESGSNTVDVVWQPLFTPSRTPLLNQRWTSLPEEAQGITIIDDGARYPGGSQYGARFNHVGTGYEASVCFFDGYNNLPYFTATESISGLASVVNVQRYYPKLRLYGADLAVPLSWFTIKTEGAYFTSTTPGADEYALYVIQLERQVKEWTFVGGYAGEIVTRSSGNPLEFAPDRGFARSFLGHAGWTIDTNRSLAFEASVRAHGSVAKAEYSQAFGQHWRATAGITWIRGAETDFIGQYHRNSYASLAIRYSF
jgi:hypothetical protein